MTYLVSLSTCQLLPRLVEFDSNSPSGFRKSSVLFPLKFPQIPHTLLAYSPGIFTTTLWFPSNLTLTPNAVVTKTSCPLRKMLTSGCRVVGKITPFPSTCVHTIMTSFVDVKEITTRISGMCTHIFIYVRLTFTFLFFSSVIL